MTWTQTFHIKFTFQSLEKSFVQIKWGEVTLVYPDDILQPPPKWTLHQKEDVSCFQLPFSRSSNSSWLALQMFDGIRLSSIRWKCLFPTCWFQQASHKFSAVPKKISNLQITGSYIPLFITSVFPMRTYIPGPASLSEVAPVLFSFQQQTHRCPYLHHSLLLLFAVGQNGISLDQIYTMYSAFRLPAKWRPTSSMVCLTLWFIRTKTKRGHTQLR